MPDARPVRRVLRVTLFLFAWAASPWAWADEPTAPYQRQGRGEP